MKIKYLCILTVLMFLFSVSLCAQKFGFAFHAAGQLAQVDGDNLRGFNKLGYRLGIEGSYFLGERHEFILAQSISHFGSNAAGASRDRMDNYFIEISATTANLLVAYAYRFSGGWENTSKFKLTGGVSLHNVISEDVDLAYNTLNTVPVEIDGLRERFLMLHFSSGFRVSQSVQIDAGLEYGLTSMAQKTNEDSPAINLTPYHLFIGAHYMIGSR